MTREEAIQYNKNLREYMRITDKKSEYKFLEENYIALDMAIKALEQETRKGQWIPYLKEGLIVKCSECGSRFSLGYNFCPHCGSCNGGDDNGNE